MVILWFKAWTVPLQRLTFFLPLPLNCFQTVYFKTIVLGFLGGSVVKNLLVDAGDSGSIPGLGRSLEKEMTIHSSVLAWEIPWTEKPGRLQSMGSQRVGHN